MAFLAGAINKWINKGETAALCRKSSAAEQHPEVGQEEPGSTSPKSGESVAHCVGEPDWTAALQPCSPEALQPCSPETLKLCSPEALKP